MRIHKISQGSPVFSDDYRRLILSMKIPAKRRSLALYSQYFNNQILDILAFICYVLFLLHVSSTYILPRCIPKIYLKAAIVPITDSYYMALNDGKVVPACKWMCVGVFAIMFVTVCFDFQLVSYYLFDPCLDAKGALELWGSAVQSVPLGQSISMHRPLSEAILTHH